MDVRQVVKTLTTGMAGMCEYYSETVHKSCHGKKMQHDKHHKHDKHGKHGKHHPCDKAIILLHTHETVGTVHRPSLS